MTNNRFLHSSVLRNAWIQVKNKSCCEQGGTSPSSGKTWNAHNEVFSSALSFICNIILYVLNSFQWLIVILTGFFYLKLNLYFYQALCYAYEYITKRTAEFRLAISRDLNTLQNQFYCFFFFLALVLFHNVFCNHR